MAHTPRVALIDGTYELFRAHYAKRPSRTSPEGQPRKACAGVLRRVFGLISADEPATHLAIAFDNPIESFRNAMWDDYKTGEGIDPELREQFDPVEELLRGLGLCVWTCVDIEADDALGAAAHVLYDEGVRVEIHTPDKDLAQVVRDPWVVQIDSARDRQWDEAGVVERFGVGPSAVADLLALAGDSADGFPGAPGIGLKTAATLLARYGSVDDIPADAAEWDVTVRGAARHAATLAEHADDIETFRELARLRLEPQFDLALAVLEVPRITDDAWNAAAQSVGMRPLATA